MDAKSLFANLIDDEKAILLALQKERVMSKDDLLHITGIKSATANRLLDQLRRNRLIVVCGEGDSTGGRKPLLYGLNPEVKAYALGINIALKHLDVAVLNYRGETVIYSVVPTSMDISPWDAVKIIRQELEARLDDHGIDKGEILACALSASSAMDRDKGLILPSVSVSFSDPLWVHFPIRTALERELDLPIMMDTAANAGCIGEYLYGHGRRHRRVLSIICGNGIRMGCIANGKLVRPTNDLDDAFGHMVVVAGGEPCTCGNYGCIDCYATGPSMRQYCAAELRKGRPGLLAARHPSELTVEHILEAAERKDPLAVETVSRAATMLGVGLANYVNLFSPDVVSCSGYLIEDSDLYYEVLEEVVRKKIAYLTTPREILFKRRSPMGKAVNGASAVAMEAFFGNFY